MLEKFDLSKKMSKSEYKELIEPARIKLSKLQRQAKEAGISIIILFEGWDASGKGTLINDLILPLDPRGFQVHTIHDPTEEEMMRPFLWQFWIKLPAKSRISIFDRSWYKRTLEDYVEGLLTINELHSTYRDINFFERQLTDDAYVIIKFFIHIDKKEQKKRFKKLEKNKSTNWRVTKKDWKHHKQYAHFLSASEEMIEATGTANAPWYIVEGHNQRFATNKVITKVTQILENNFMEIKKRKMEKEKEQVRIPSSVINNMDQSKLNKINLHQEINDQNYIKSLKEHKKKLRQAEYQIYKRRIPVIILFEGWDAAGKGGNIKRLVSNLDPRGYEVVPVSAPNEIEKSYHFLWRFWKEIPKAGHIVIFDRSWYGRVLVERVEKLCQESEWKRAYREINEMEKQFINFGGVLLKFWLQIDKEEQLLRFKAREENSDKKWKITPEDWRNREKWDQYKSAIDEMFFKTSTHYAPWTIVESNNKKYARIKVLRETYQAIKKRLETNEVVKLEKEKQ